MDDLQYLRKLSLVLVSGEQGLDLSDFRVQFQVQASDLEQPNNAMIRVFNLSPDTIESIRTPKVGTGVQGEYTGVVLQAGYGDNFGIIFRGSIKQYRVGRIDAKTTYFDILAADWDIGYNQGFVNTSLQNPTSAEVVKESVKAMVEAEKTLNPSSSKSIDGSISFGDFADQQHVPQLRGKVLFGMARASIRNSVITLDGSWSIQDGVVQVLPLRGYSDGEVVQLNRATGMLGVPEQTDGGIQVRCLINPRLKVGNLIQLNNDEIKTLFQSSPDSAPVPFNQWTGFQYSTKLSPSGHYRIFVIEYQGDTRGTEWEAELICLAVDLSAPNNQSVEAKN